MMQKKAAATTDDATNLGLFMPPTQEACALMAYFTFLEVIVNPLLLKLRSPQIRLYGAMKLAAIKDETRISRAKQLDDGIGDTLVSPDLASGTADYRFDAASNSRKFIGLLQAVILLESTAEDHRPAEASLIDQGKRDDAGEQQV